MAVNASSPRSNSNDGKGLDAKSPAINGRAYPIEDHRYDVVVVGASLAGCSAAAFLARRGAKVAVVDRRAKATLDYLVSRGIQAERVTTLSYGEERPVCRLHIEACWAKNRRAHFLVMAR